MKRKNIVIAIIIVLIAVVVTVAITQSNKLKESQTTTTTQQTTEKNGNSTTEITEQTTENNEASTEESAIPLTENEIKTLFLKAHKLYLDWFSSANNVDADWNKTTIIDGVEYFTVNSTEITSVDALESEFAKYFDKEVYDQQIDSIYVMNNGKMYGNAVLVEGGDVSWEKHKLTVKTNTDTECTFTITSYLEDQERELDYKLKVINGEWKFTEVFNCVTVEDLVLK